MSFNNQWHNYEVARYWPQGSVVLLRTKLKTVTHHQYCYLLVSNWQPQGSFWNRDEHSYQLVEEPKKQ